MALKEATELLDLLTRQIQAHDDETQTLKRSVAERDVRIASLESELLVSSQGIEPKEESNDGALAS